MENKYLMVPVVAGVIIKKDDRYLLVQERKKSAYGLWNFPAGHVDIDESIEEAAVREAKEEVGYDIKLIKKISVHQNSVNEPVKHVFYAEIIAGELNFPKEELLDANWFSFDEIKSMRDKLRSGDWIIQSIEILEQNRF